MNIVIAPNAFKGSLSAEEAAACIEEGIYESKLDCRTTLFPIADGGDGTASLLIKNKHADIVNILAYDPLGRLVPCSFGWIPSEKTAVMDMSSVAGIKLLKKEELNPLYTNTYGVGEMILAALDKGAKGILIGVGGSATVDGGTGLLKALGLRYYNRNNEEIMNLPAGLNQLNSIRVSNLDKRLKRTHIIVLCDVKNKLSGKKGAAFVFAPQKGADKKEVMQLETCMKQWNRVTGSILGKDMNDFEYGGAAGGMAAGLAAYSDARLVSGTDFFLDELKFDKLLATADVVITGEGCIDRQTLDGKGPFGVAQKAKQQGIPVIGMAGTVKASDQKTLSRYFDLLIPVNQKNESIENSIKNTKVNLKHAAFTLGKNFPF